MKKTLVISLCALFIITFLGASLIIAEDEIVTAKLYSTTETEPSIVGASCGTVTPGYQDECCIRKGYLKWNPEEWECTNETESDDDTTTCTEEYSPVCGLVQVQCIKAPCPHIYQTFSNKCELNKNKLAKFAYEGECKEDETKEEPIACTMDAKMCPDGSYVSRIGPNCEFAPCPRQINISKEKVCCKIYGYGTNMTETQAKYRITYKEECKIPEDFVGGNREIVNKSYCLEQIKEDRQEFLENKEKIIRERNRIKNNYANNSDCPESCICSGSTIKCEFENKTRVMTVHAGNSGNVIVQVKNVNASTNVTLYKADGKVYGIFKDNETHEIILPDEARERIKEMEQLKEKRRINWTDENITLNEEGYYEIQAKKKSRLFWIVPVKEKFQSHVDSETGEVVHVRKAWWGFLARDVKEE